MYKERYENMDKDRTEMDTTEKTEKELPADGGRGEAENRFSQDRTREGHTKHKGRFGAGVLTGMAGMLVIIQLVAGRRTDAGQVPSGQSSGSKNLRRMPG